MNNSQPAVSIVIPCYNSAQFLHATIESALNQTLPPVDIIVVDDGSVDESATIAESFGPPVRVIRQPNQGPSIARNVGTEASQGDYLMYLDADDLLAPQSLELLTSALEGKTNTAAVMSCATFDTDPQRPIQVHSEPYDHFLPHIIRSNLRNPICWLTPRNLYKRVGGFSNESRPFEDWDFWAQIALTGADLVCIPFVGGFYRRHEASVMKTVTRTNRERGHVKVKERLINGLLERQELLERWSDEMFWSAWSAIYFGRQSGLTWSELNSLVQSLNELLRRGPMKLRRSRFAIAVRLLGVRRAAFLKRLLMSATPFSIENRP